jgi:hypothetical protein
VPLGTTIVVEPAGGFAVGVAVPTPPEGWPVLLCCEPPMGHGGMLISMSFRCLARMIVRTPGVLSALAIGSVEDELLLELELPPHALSAVARIRAATSPIPVRVGNSILRAIRLPPLACPSPGAYPDASGSETRAPTSR